MEVLGELTTEDLERLPRADGQEINRSVEGWRHRLAEDGASHDVLAAIDEYVALPRRDRSSVAALLNRYSNEAPAQTAVVFLWGGARGNNPTLAVCGQPRLSEDAGIPWLDDDSDRRRVAHEFLWDPLRAWDGEARPSPVEPRLAFQKLWTRQDWSKGLLKGCGTAFGTKILYWAVRAHLGIHPAAERPVPLIYDARVFASLMRRGPGSVRGFEQTWTHPQSKVFSDAYEAYCNYAYDSAERLNQLARQLNIDANFLAEDIERWHFDLGSAEPDPPVAGDHDDASYGGGPEEIEPDSDLPADYVVHQEQTVDRVLRSLAQAAERYG